MAKMRITGGNAKGQHLKVPKSRLVRPTTEVVREAVFSMLETMPTNWVRILDLYAGSGALGIEALSRNAEWADFVDQEPQCCAIIKENLKKTGLAEKAHVYCCRVAKALTFLNSRYDIILMDPPYSDQSLNNLLNQLAVSQLVEEESVIVVSHAHRFPLNPNYDGLQLIKERRYGDTCISIYQKRVPEKSEEKEA